MSRKSIISFVAISLFTAATLASGAAQAHHSGGGGGGGPHGGHGGGMHVHNHWKNWHHWARYHDHIYVRPVSYTVRESTPGPCTCLTKNYTPEGRVVFQDLCTKETASAPVDGTDDHAQATDGPTNFAGQTYQDYLKANPQAQAEQKKN